MSKIKNGGLDHYGAEPFEQQQFGTAGVEGVKCVLSQMNVYCVFVVTGQCRIVMFLRKFLSEISSAAWRRLVGRHVGTAVYSFVTVILCERDFLRAVCVFLSAIDTDVS